MDGTLARALLGVPSDATSEIISRAFRVAAFDAHPDRGGDALHFRQLIAARDLLLATAADVATTPCGHRFAAATAPVRSATLDVVDSARPSPTRRTPAGPVVDPSFDQVLARVMAA